MKRLMGGGQEDVQAVVRRAGGEPTDLAAGVRPALPNPVCVRERVGALLRRKAQLDVARNVADLRCNGSAVVARRVLDRLLHGRELVRRDKVAGGGAARNGRENHRPRATADGPDLDGWRTGLWSQPRVDGGLLVGAQLVVMPADGTSGERAFD